MKTEQSITSASVKMESIRLVTTSIPNENGNPLTYVIQDSFAFRLSPKRHLHSLKNFFHLPPRISPDAQSKYIEQRYIISKQASEILRYWLSRHAMLIFSLLHIYKQFGQTPIRKQGHRYVEL